MIYVYQIFHGGVDVDPEDMFTRHPAGPTRGHQLKLCKPHCSSRVRRNSFAVRTINDWNGLPDMVVTSPSLNTFKNRLDLHWEAVMFSIPDSD